MTQSEKSELFLQQHRSKRILLLPNVWDALSARLIASAGFNSLATASFSLAAAHGYEDGEKIPFPKLMEVVGEITKAVDVPVSVDFERGYAMDLPLLADNVRRVLDAGAVGINIEDRDANGRTLTSVAAQCKKLETIREAAIKHGVHMVINARTDAYLLKLDADYFNDTLSRGKAYRDTGADCFYPIGIDNYPDLARVLDEIDLPQNVLLIKPLADLKKLEEMGVSRVSLGPGSLKYVLTKLRGMVKGLMQYDSTELFREELMASGEVMELVKALERP
jgi:2-methylisocitrate lyase-like PEP mutase family enzyme